LARILIVGGGCRGRDLARALGADGHALRITTRSEVGRASIEALGAECWIGTPDRIATLRGALENATLLCWLLGTASGSSEELRALHGSRLAFMLSQAIDTTVRGVVYEAAGSVEPATLAEGERIVREHCQHNAIPFAMVAHDPRDIPGWLALARARCRELLGQG
jgi:hypothetical protein